MIRVVYKHCCAVEIVQVPGPICACSPYLSIGRANNPHHFLLKPPAQSGHVTKSCALIGRELCHVRCRRRVIGLFPLLVIGGIVVWCYVGPESRWQVLGY